MSDMSDLARNPRTRRTVERLLYLAAWKGEADQVKERLSWGVDPNCAHLRYRRPLIGCVRGPSPNLATLRALLASGADPNLTDRNGLTALDHARRKLARLQLHNPRPAEKSPSLDENNQLQLGAAEQEWLDEMRRELGPDAKEFVRIYWEERRRAARRVFDDPAEVERIVDLLEPLTSA